MTFTAAMRLGSLEVLAALALFGVVASRLRPNQVAAQERAEAMTLRLLVRDSAAAGTRKVEFTIREGAPAAIGRSGDADVALSDPEVSRRHARLELVRGVLYLTDAASSNGTFLNGKPLPSESIELRVGDDIDVGTTRLTVELMEAVR